MRQHGFPLIALLGVGAMALPADNKALGSGLLERQDGKQCHRPSFADDRITNITVVDDASAFSAARPARDPYPGVSD